MMKRTFLTLAVATIGFTITFAQESNLRPIEASKQERKPQRSRTPDEIANIKTKRLNEDVQLTIEQQEKVHAIYLKEAQDRTNRAAMREEINQAINNILTPEQQKMREEKIQVRQNETIRAVPIREGTLKAAPKSTNSTTVK